MGWLVYLALLVVCSLGHALIWVRIINWTHGVRTQKFLIKLFRIGLHLILSGSPLLFIALTWEQAPDVWYSIPAWLQPYLLLTAVLGGIAFPSMVLTYWLKGPPGALLSQGQEKLKLISSSGIKGSGPHGLLASLPWNQIYEVDLVEKEIVVPGLPAQWDGLLILHLSDLHLCGRPGKAYFESVFARCAEKPCDLLVITGDLIDSDEHYEWLQLLRSLSWKEAALAIRGNHDARFDAGRVNSELEQMGIQPIGGQARMISIRQQPVLVMGNEAPWLLPIPDLHPFEAHDCFRLALIHTPDQFHWAKQQGANLVLAGHCHGGQIRFPGFGSIFVPCKTGRKYDMGLFQEGETVLHVSRGLSGSFPVRYFCRPEVTWLTLRCGDSVTA
jgi:predicted MPP superfamily phosphohydrolase